MGRRTMARRLVLALTVVASLGCSRAEEAAPPADRAKNGEAIYASMCKGCHGARGEGGRGPALRDIHTRTTLPALVDVIDKTMPYGEPEKCTGSCAEDVGTYVWEKLRGAIVCDAPVPLARGLRLLTNREWLATVQDLLGTTPPSSLPACGTTTFAFDPKGRPTTSVHVAGSFNGWAGTVAAGGWPLTKLANGTFSATRTVPPGAHQYKLVLDDTEWILDPTNPKTVANGVGGENNVLDVSCGSAGPAVEADWTRGFPPDTRPEGFPFDDHGPGRVVGAVLMDEHVRAVGAVAKSADLGKLVGCDRAQRETCTTTFVRAFGRRAFRRPLTDAEAARFSKVAASAPSFDVGARAAIRALLLSPSFVYRSELGEPRGDGTFRLGPWEVASALSYAFWGTMPDEALFTAAEKGELASPAGIEREARRLLASPRARARVGVFAEQWLGVDGIGQITKQETTYPFPPALREAMREETRRFVTHVVFDGSHRVDELFNADYTFVDDRLAAHYGLAARPGNTHARVPLDGARAGLLSHGAVMASTGHSDQSSPIRRGLFVRRRLLCQDFAPPPPNAGGVPKVDPNATTRERFAQHTANATCKSCHQYIDDVGFGFERFDTLGRLRDTEAGKPIDSAGDMNDVEGLGTGTHAPFKSMRELAATLAASKSAKVCVARQAWRFARGQLDDDVCMTRSLADRFVESGGDVQELLIAIATDPAFVVRK